MAKMMTLDLNLCKELNEIVEKLTTSGKPQLDSEELKRLKKICKQSDDYVKKSFHLIMMQLEREHSEIRLSALQLSDILFTRSHCFRDLLLADFQYFMELTLETNPECPLPSPREAAKSLKCKAVDFINQWNLKFGDVYKKLSLGYNFLKECKKINFEDLRALSVADRQRDEERQQRVEAQQNDRITKALDEMTEATNDVKMCLTQAENCLVLLLPDPEGFNIHQVKSPEIFPNKNPWKRKRSTSDPRLRNKSTKYMPKEQSSQSNGKHNEILGTCGNCDTNVNQRGLSKISATAKSYKLEEKTKSNSIGNTTESTVLIKEEVCGSSEQNSDNLSSRSEFDWLKKDTKPSTAELEKSVQVYKQQQHTSKTSGEAEATTIASPTSGEVEATTVASSTSGQCEERQELHEEGSEEGESEEDSEDEEFLEEDIVRDHGLGSQLYSININVTPGIIQIQETPDNEDIILSLKDCVRLINSKFMPSIQKWLEVFTKSAANQTHVKRALDLKSALEKMKQKIEKLKIVKAPKNLHIKSDTKPSTSSKVDSDEDDDDFEEVATKEGYEPRIPDELREEYGLVEKPPRASTNPDWVLSQIVEDGEEDPTTWMYNMKKINQQMKTEHQSSDENELITNTLAEPSTSKEGSSKAEKVNKTASRSKRASEAPVIPFSTDLYHWGEKKETPLLVRYDSEHRFWTPKDDVETVDINALASMNSRVINFVGKFDPVKWKCRAPMANGTLCQRMDRYKCPFHGKILPRNAVGEPSEAADAIRIKQEAEIKQEEQTPEWDDPDLQAAISEAKGVNLQRKVKGKKGKGKGKGTGKMQKYPGLTDINKVHNTSRVRLEKKVLSRNSIKRVAAAYDRLDEKKRFDKFGNSFNYVHGSAKQ